MWKLWGRDLEKEQDKQESDKEPSDDMPVLPSDMEDGALSCKGGAGKRIYNNQQNYSSS